MALSPFQTVVQTYPGQLGPEVIDSSGTFRRFWLGQPGNMIQLPSPNNGYTVDWSSGEVEHRLMSTGSAVSRRGNPKRRYTLGWGRLGGKDWQLISGFYRRAMGGGPWCFVSPDDTNRMPGNATLCGAMNGDISQWVASAGTLTAPAGGVPGVLPSGVLRWAGGIVNGYVACAASIVGGNPVPDVATATQPGTAIPYLVAESCTTSVYAAIVAGGAANVTLWQSGRNADGTINSGSSGSAGTTLTTTPQRITVTSGPNGLGTAPYVVPFLACNSITGGTVILISNPQVEYEPAATPWQMGNHVARVIIPAGISRAADPRMFTASGLVLAEV